MAQKAVSLGDAVTTDLTTAQGLDVGDLRQRLGGELALHVREGKGARERLVPYGDLDWCLAVVDAWEGGDQDDRNLDTD